jgi:hypothetical protein
MLRVEFLAVRHYAANYILVKACAYVVYARYAELETRSRDAHRQPHPRALGQSRSGLSPGRKARFSELAGRKLLILPWPKRPKSGPNSGQNPSGFAPSAALRRSPPCVQERERLHADCGQRGNAPSDTAQARAGSAGAGNQEERKCEGTTGSESHERERARSPGAGGPLILPGACPSVITPLRWRSQRSRRGFPTGVAPSRVPRPSRLRHL